MADTGIFGIIPTEWFKFIDIGVGSSMTAILYGVVFCLAAFVAYRRYKNSKVFIFKARVFRRREGKQPKEVNYKAGFIKAKDGIQKFRIKLSKWRSWEYVDIDKLPDARYIDENNTVYYEQLDPTTYIQVKRIFCEKPVDTQVLKFTKDYLGYKTGDLIETPIDSAIDYLEKGLVEKVGAPQSHFIMDAYYEPIPTDTKRVVVMGLSNVREALKLDVFKLQAMTIGALVVIAVTFLIAYYLLNARGTVG